METRSLAVEWLRITIINCYEVTRLFENEKLDTKLFMKMAKTYFHFFTIRLATLFLKRLITVSRLETFPHLTMSDPMNCPFL